MFAQINLRRFYFFVCAFVLVIDDMPVFHPFFSFENEIENTIASRTFGFDIKGAQRCSP
jgi:hypothetical protein